MTVVNPTPPRAGPCSPWVTAAEVLSIPDPDAGDLDQNLLTDALAATMASIASEVLYMLSGQQYTGACGPVTVRPISRPKDGDTRGMIGTMPGGYLAIYGWPSAWGNAGGGAAMHYGVTEAPEVELGAFPILNISQVTIDGIIIPPTEYYLQDRRVLVRRRPTGQATPTARYGWPTSQLVDLPPTEEGTFAVTYTYGAPPPVSGYWAALKLSQMLVRDACGEDGVFPQRVTSVTRQGVSVAVTDVMDFFSRGLTGIYQLDLFIRAYNPSGATRKPIAWSPDLGRPRRMPTANT